MTDLDLTSLGDIRESEISDKSKASGLAKGIVCVQSIWFIIQCALRFAQSKAISLLEVCVFLAFETHALFLTVSS